MKKVIFLSVLLIVSNLFWLGTLVLKAIDLGVTQTYQQASYETAAQALKQAIVLAKHDLIGKDAEQVIKLIPRDVDDFEPFIKEGCLYYSEICLKLDEAQVITDITLFDSH
ncbi:hypothetical protein [Vibrio sp. LaRot3]|uniref:hypothetical protein n=1 Tax=Vibrio sp. LaRot3 TaxID=2998829 RepID=UPI0022CDECA3|nr:hypothetical protein [Vibrio sp. LaRot3]MDA0147372.1 hypothetical protein [Vibrio sp. LaRot3]